MRVESLEQIAENLGWSPQRHQQARDRADEPRPMNVTDRDHARAQALANAVKHTASALDEAS
jgi:hypothetical protein